MMSYQNAFLGSLVADAVSMPVHWYYDVDALDRDYGDFDRYLAPKNPHPDSILWRSKYEPIGEKDDILREQAKQLGEARTSLPSISGRRRKHFEPQARMRTVPRNHQVRGIRSLGVAGQVRRSHADSRMAQRHLRRRIPPRILHQLRPGKQVVQLWNFRSSHRWT